MSTAKLHRRQRRLKRFVPRPREVFGEDVIRPRVQSLGGKTCVSVYYNYAEPYGQAEAFFTFEIGTFFRLATGGICRVENLSVGAALQMEDGGFCLVTKVGVPRVLPRSRAVPGQDGLKHCQIIGTVKHIGNVVIDVRASGGHVSTTTPDHLYWSETRGGWVQAARLFVGEQIGSLSSGPICVESISEPRHGHVELFNLEVDDAHTFYVGNPPVLVHNGSCIRQPVRVPDASVGTKTYKKGWPGEVVGDHRLSRAVAKVFGGDPHAPANLVLEAFEANARKGAREGQLLSSYYKYLKQGLSPEDALEVLRPEVRYLVNDVHARPVDPRLLDKLPG